MISKIDLADSETKKKLTAKLKELNPRAGIDMALDGEIDPKHLIDSGRTPRHRATPALSPRPRTATASRVS